ncbi:MAG: hypothetical protein CBB97_23740 [Candidatus Endolissoclinum sp. TMED37]|nr:MAG: hypothetical protein CBB97_23740 [Candidatus Endolissoclinum sp. TMED37]
MNNMNNNELTEKTSVIENKIEEESIKIDDLNDEAFLNSDEFNSFVMNEYYTNKAISESNLTDTQIEDRKQKLIRNDLYKTDEGTDYGIVEQQFFLEKAKILQTDSNNLKLLAENIFLKEVIFNNKDKKYINIQQPYFWKINNNGVWELVEYRMCIKDNNNEYIISSAEFIANHNIYRQPNYKFKEITSAKSTNKYIVPNLNEVNTKKELPELKYNPNGSITELFKTLKNITIKTDIDNRNKIEYNNNNNNNDTSYIKNLFESFLRKKIEVIEQSNFNSIMKSNYWKFIDNRTKSLKTYLYNNGKTISEKMEEILTNHYKEKAFNEIQNKDIIEIERKNNNNIQYLKLISLYKKYDKKRKDSDSTENIIIKKLENITDIQKYKQILYGGK